MNDSTYDVDNTDSNYIEQMQMKIAELESVVEKQSEMIETLKTQSSWDEIIDNYVDKWYDNNNDNVDIGRIELWNIFGLKKEIDVMPDNIEKHIYKKMMKILFSIITSPNQ